LSRYIWTASSWGERVAFRQINKKTGNRLRQQLVDGETREPVETHEKGRGYEYAKGSHLMIVPRAGGRDGRSCRSSGRHSPPLGPPLCCGLVPLCE
jgi:hypothetical protein